MSGWESAPVPSPEPPSGAPTAERLHEIAARFEKLGLVLLYAIDLLELRKLWLDVPPGLKESLETNTEADDLHMWAEMLASGVWEWRRDGNHQPS